MTTGQIFINKNEIKLRPNPFVPLGTVSSYRRKSQTLNNIGQQNSILSVGKYWKFSKPESAMRQIGWTRSNYCIFLRVHRILNFVWRNRSCYILFECKNAPTSIWVAWYCLVSFKLCTEMFIAICSVLWTISIKLLRAQLFFVYSSYRETVSLLNEQFDSRLHRVRSWLKTPSLIPWVRK